MIYLLLLVGIALGVSWRELFELKKIVMKHISKPLENGPTVTPGLYRPPNENYQSSAIIQPKTPQRVQWEAENEQRKEVLGIK